MNTPKEPICPKCNGTKWYQYSTEGTPHSKICEYCCKHDQGFWKLPKEHYDKDGGMLCCLAGCGFTKPDDGSGVTLPEAPKNAMRHELASPDTQVDAIKFLDSNTRQARRFNRETLVVDICTAEEAVEYATASLLMDMKEKMQDWHGTGIAMIKDYEDKYFT